MVSVSLTVSVLQLMQMASKSSVAGLDSFGFESHISRRGATNKRTSANPAAEAKNLMKFFVMRSGKGCCLLRSNKMSQLSTAAAKAKLNCLVKIEHENNFISIDGINSYLLKKNR